MFLKKRKKKKKRTTCHRFPKDVPLARQQQNTRNNATTTKKQTRNGIFTSASFCCCCFFFCCRPFFFLRSEASPDDRVLFHSPFFFVCRVSFLLRFVFVSFAFAFLVSLFLFFSTIRPQAKRWPRRPLPVFLISFYRFPIWLSLLIRHPSRIFTQCFLPSFFTGFSR